MVDFLMRDDAPLSEQEWAKLDEVVVGTARKLLVGRRVIELTGPLGLGAQVVPLFTMGASDGVTQVAGRDFLRLEQIQQDFILSTLDIQAAKRQGMPIELGPAAAASAACARQEDELVFKALFNTKGRQSVKLGDWSEPDAILANVVEATQKLVDAAKFGPFAVVLSPGLYAKTQRVARGMGRLVSKLIKDVAEGGVFRSPFLQENQGVVISQGKHNLDLVIG